MSKLMMTIEACRLLRMARDVLVQADAPKAADKVRRALKSAEGAVRNAQCRESRERET